MKNARWTEESGWVVEDIQHEFWQPAKHEARGFTRAMWALMFVGALMISWSALAHDAAHPEWDSWLMSQHNQKDGMCCDGEDTLALADNEWRTVGNHYEVLREALRSMIERETGGKPAPKKSQVVATLKALEPELRERGIASAAVFGSVVRGQARPDSDVDVLVDIDPAAAFDLLDLVGVKNLLADRLGRAVDVVEKEALKPRIRDNILAEAETVF